MKKISWSYGEAKFAATYELNNVLPLSDLILSTIQSYYFSTIRPSSIHSTQMTRNAINLIKNYYEINNHQTSIFCLPKKLKKTVVATSEKKAACLITGGKDSVHLLMRLVERYGKNNVIAIYVSNINKSEAAAEKKAVVSIAKLVGVKCSVVQVGNGIKITRTHHNIGLREQLLIALALPIMAAFGAQNIYFGLTHGAAHRPPALWTDSDEAMNLIARDCLDKGIKIKWHYHLDSPNIDEDKIVYQLITKWPVLWDHISSCYTQLTWRGKMKQMLESKVNMPIYNGCGYCLKCCRINASFLLHRQDYADIPLKNKLALYAHIKHQYENKLEKDHFLGKLLARLAPEMQRRTI